jgi:membrane fusion protein (multidrug efflux system)
VSQRLEAQIGVRQLGRVEILAGLVPGDLVVTAGHTRLLRGEAVPVRVVDLESPAASGRPATAGASAPAGRGAPGASGAAPRP